MIHIANLRCDYFRLRGVCEEKKLIELVRGDVANDPAEILPVPEPGWARARVDAMRAEANGLNDFAYGAGFDEVAGFNGSRVFEALAVKNRIDAFCLRLNAPHFS